MAYWAKNGTQKLNSLSIGKSWQSANTCASWRITNDNNVQRLNGSHWESLDIFSNLEILQLSVGYCWWSATTPEVWFLARATGNAGGPGPYSVYRWNGSGFDCKGPLPFNDTPTSITVGYGGVYVLGTSYQSPANTAVQNIYGWATSDLGVTGEWVFVAWGLAHLSNICSGYIRGKGTTTPVLYVLLSQKEDGSGKVFQSKFENWCWQPWQELSGQSLTQLNAICEDSPVGVDSSGKVYSWENNQWTQLVSTPPHPHMKVVNPPLTTVTEQYSTIIYGVDSNGQEWIYSN